MTGHQLLNKQHLLLMWYLETMLHEHSLVTRWWLLLLLLLRHQHILLLWSWRWQLLHEQP
jgi:hypothetical protein